MSIVLPLSQLSSNALPREVEALCHWARGIAPHDSVIIQRAKMGPFCMSYEHTLLIYEAAEIEMKLQSERPN